MSDIDFTRRSPLTEIMDSGVPSFSVFDESLEYIETMNSFTLGYRPTLQWLEKVLPRLGNRASLLDVGCGRGALLRMIRDWAESRNIDLQLAGIDIDPWAKPAAERATPSYMEIDYHTGNVFDAGLRADIIVCSHMTHHMADEDVVKFLHWLESHAAHGWFISDLHRHPFAYALARGLATVTPGNEMVRHDGPVSVARAFTAPEWRRLLRQAGIPRLQSRVSWHFPFRHGVARWKAAPLS